MTVGKNLHQTHLNSFEVVCFCSPWKCTISASPRCREVNAPHKYVFTQGPALFWPSISERGHQRPSPEKLEERKRCRRRNDRGGGMFNARGSGPGSERSPPSVPSHTSGVHPHYPAGSPLNPKNLLVLFIFAYSVLVKNSVCVAPGSCQGEFGGKRFAKMNLTPSQLCRDLILTGSLERWLSPKPAHAGPQAQLVSSPEQELPRK